jgi:predicted Fe-Mo cluster-binding NifX family protein
MKVAVPTKDNFVDDHFGHCAYYTIFTIEGGKVISTETLPSPQGCGCKSNIASVLKKGSLFDVGR